MSTQPTRDLMQELLDSLRTNDTPATVPAGITGPDRAGLPTLDVLGRGGRRSASLSFIDDGTHETALWVEVKAPLALDELDNFINELRYLRDVTRRYRAAEQTQGGAA